MILTEDTRFAIREVRFRAIQPYPRPPFQDATMGPFHTFSFAAVWLRDEDGYEGESLFFASQLPLLEAHFLPILFHAGGAKNYADLYRKMYWSIRNEGYRGPAAIALGQLDWALYDLAARRAGRPLHRFLGATRDCAKIYASGGGVNYSLAELQKEMADFVERGYSLLKMKVGIDRGRDLAEDARRVAAVRRAIGDGVGLALDANQVWTVTQATDFARRVAEYDISWLEEPVHSADLYAIRRLCADSPVPIAYGESERTDRVFPVLADCGVGHLQPIAGYLAGIGEWFAVRDLAHQRRLRFTSGGYSQVTAQLIATGEEEDLVEYLEANNGTINPYLSVGPAIENGYFLLPDVSGSSIRIDWDYIARKGMLARDEHWDKNKVDRPAPVVM